MIDLDGQAHHSLTTWWAPSSPKAWHNQLLLFLKFPVVPQNELLKHAKNRWI